MCPLERVEGLFLRYHLVCFRGWHGLRVNEQFSTIVRVTPIALLSQVGRSKARFILNTKGGIHHRRSDLWISWPWIETIGGSDPRITAIRFHQHFARWTPIERSPIIMWSWSKKSASWLASFDTVSCCHSVLMCRYLYYVVPCTALNLFILHY